MTIVEELHTLAKDDPSRVVRAHEEFARLRQARGLNLEGRPYPVALEPLLVDHKLVDDTARGLEGLLQILEEVGDAYRQDERVRRFIGTYEVADQWLCVEPPIRPYIGVCRFDGMFIDGVYRVMEANTCCPGSVLKVPAQFPLWRDIISDIIGGHELSPGPQPFIETPDLFLRCLLAMHRRQFGQDPVAAGVVTLNGLYFNEVDLMATGFEHLGVEARVSDLLSVEARSDGSVHLDGLNLDLVYHKLDQLDLLRTEACGPYLDASLKGRFSFLSSLMAQWVLEDSATLALLSDPRFHDLFDTDQLRLIDVHVPWTRVMEPVRTTGPDGELRDLSDYVVKHRQRLVLKHRGLTRGEEVHIGPITSQKVWEEVSARALASRSYIVQDYVPLPRREFITPGTAEMSTMWYELDPYLFDGHFAGFQCRASLDAVVNVAKNGMMVPVLVTGGQDG